MSGPRIRVMRNPLRENDQPWLVICGYCAGGGESPGFFEMLAFAFGGAGRLGWAADWRTAQEFATQHARRHVEARCPTCWHIPATPLVTEDAV